MLASRASAGNARTAFLQLPSQLRQISHQQSSRSFSASASTKFELTDVVAAPPLAVLNGLHAIGIPWYAAIPTAAILIRGVFGYYFASAPARRRQQIRNNLMPLISADVGLSILKERRSGKAPEVQLLRMKNRIVRTHELGKAFGGPLIAWTSFVNFGTLIATAEAVRMKCGARDGLLSTILTPFNWLGRQICPDIFPPPVDPAETRAQELAERMERVREMRLQQAQEQKLGADGEALYGQSSMSENMFQDTQPSATPLSDGQSLVSDPLFDSTQAAAPPLVNVDASWFDPSLKAEGFSWCADLTAADPYQVLPYVTGAVMLGNILLNPLTTPRPSLKAQSMPAPLKFLMTRYSNMQLFGAAVACLFSQIMQNMPAAIVLYIFSSIITGFVQRRWLDLVMPLRKPIMPCARGTRVRSKKEWSAKM